MLQNPINQSTQQQLDEGEAKKRQRGTGFTNISRILGANVGAGQRMGTAIGGQLSQQAEQIRKGIQQGQSQFEAGLKKGTSDESGKIATATGAMTGIMDKTGSPTFTTTPKSINAQPTKPGYSEMLTPGTSPIASAEPDYEKIGRELRGAEYAGPKNIENIQQQQQRAANLATLGRLSGLSGGQEELLRSQVASRGRYGLGQSALDTMLLGKEGQKQLEAARSQTGAVSAQAGQAESAAQSQAQAAQSSIEANKLAALQKIQEQVESSIQTGTEQAKTHYATAQIAKNALKKIYEAKDPNQIKLDADELNALSKAKDLGIDFSYKIDPRNKKLTDQILQQIAGAGQGAYGGGLMLDKTQQEKLKNLDLLLGSKQKRQDIDRDVFGDVSKQAENLLETEYENKLKTENLKNIYDPELFKKAAIEGGGKADYFSDPSRTQAFWKDVQELMTSQPGYTPVSESGRHRVRSWNNYIDALKAKESQYQKSNVQTVQDYLNKILGIK